jgi:hypothetical protein
MTLGNMRENGVRSLAVQCHQCRHEVIMNVDHLPVDLTVPSFGPRMGCTQCGTIGADVRPNWRERQRDAPSASAPAAPTVSWSCVHPSLAYQWRAGGAQSGEDWHSPFSDLIRDTARHKRIYHDSLYRKLSS